MKILKPRIFVYLLIYFLISFSACGYKLRDNQLNLDSQIISISFEPSEINLSFFDQFKRQTAANRIYLNQVSKNSDLYLEILEHNVSRYSAALGYGARTKEARLEYFLKISLHTGRYEEKIVVEVRDSSNYSFDESKILAIEEIEKQTKENFFTNAINRINFAALNFNNEIN